MKTEMKAKTHMRYRKRVDSTLYNKEYLWSCTIVNKYYH